MNYLHNKDLYIEITISKAQGKLTRTAQQMLNLLAEHTVEKNKYWSEDDKLDCKQGGILALFGNWHNFDEVKAGAGCCAFPGGNVFSYLTEIYKRGSAAAFNSIYSKRGDPTHSVKIFSIEGSNDGMGLHSI